MGHSSNFVFFFISHLLLLSSANEAKWWNPSCPFFSCGNLGHIGFPFSNRTHPECGLMIIDNCNEPVQKIQLGKDGPWYNITNIAQDDSITLEDRVFQSHLDNRNCESLKNLMLPSSPFLSFKMPSNLTLVKCPRNLHNKTALFNLSCHDSVFYYNLPKNDLPSLPPPECLLVQLPVNKNQNTTDLFKLLTGIFSLQVRVSWDCVLCQGRGGRCQSDSKGNYYCAEPRECRDCYRRGGKCFRDNKGKLYCSQTGEGTRRLKLGLGLVGKARGLEYLHRGWITRIVHLDMKPRSILLYEDFCPKISDFGMAKICPRKESVVSMTGAWGTVSRLFSTLNLQSSPNR